MLGFSLQSPLHSDNGCVSREGLSNAPIRPIFSSHKFFQSLLSKVDWHSLGELSQYLSTWSHGPSLTQLRDTMSCSQPHVRQLPSGVSALPWALFQHYAIILASENLRKETKQNKKKTPLLLRDFRLPCTSEILNCTDLIVWVTRIIWHKEEKGCSYLGEGGREGRKRKKYDVKYFPSMLGFRSIFPVYAPSEEYLSVCNLKRVKTPAPSHPTPSPSCL